MKSFYRLLFVATLLVPQAASAILVARSTRFEGSVLLSFPVNSGRLTDADRLIFARQLPCINSLELNAVNVVLWSAEPIAAKDAGRTMRLTHQRQAAVRQLLRDAGLAESKIGVEINAFSLQGQSADPGDADKDGLTEIRYSGSGKDDYERLCSL